VGGKQKEISAFAPCELLQE